MAMRPSSAAAVPGAGVGVSGRVEFMDRVAASAQNAWNVPGRPHYDRKRATWATELPNSLIAAPQALAAGGRAEPAGRGAPMEREASGYRRSRVDFLKSR